MLELLRTRRVFNKLGLGLGLNIGTHNQNINVGKHVTYRPPHPKTKWKLQEISQSKYVTVQ